MMSKGLLEATLAWPSAGPQVCMEYPSLELLRRFSVAEGGTGSVAILVGTGVSSNS
jgi:hypothetical protein